MSFVIVTLHGVKLATSVANFHHTKNDYVQKIENITVTIVSV